MGWHSSQGSTVLRKKVFVWNQIALGSNSVIPKRFLLFCWSATGPATEAERLFFAGGKGLITKQPIASGLAHRERFSQMLALLMARWRPSVMRATDLKARCYIEVTLRSRGLIKLGVAGKGEFPTVPHHATGSPPLVRGRVWMQLLLAFHTNPRVAALRFMGKQRPTLLPRFYFWGSKMAAKREQSSSCSMFIFIYMRPLQG